STKCCIWGGAKKLLELVEHQLVETFKGEGEPVSLRCDYDTTADYVSVYWFKHHSDSNLNIAELARRRLTLTDTALYYCALETVIQRVQEVVQQPEHTYLTSLKVLF
uniref:Ig-like domain-containing protein n=1 Tax=Cyclopterus lumpus TaxID=8103 RepID=A0A8C2ZUM5_CYCLU